MTNILGSLRSDDGDGVVRMEDRYETDIDDLWTALTDPGRLARWYGEVAFGAKCDSRLDPFSSRFQDAYEKPGESD